MTRAIAKKKDLKGIVCVIFGFPEFKIGLLGFRCIIKLKIIFIEISHMACLLYIRVTLAFTESVYFYIRFSFNIMSLVLFFG